MVREQPGSVLTASGDPVTLAVVGSPVAHSLSPAIHGAAAAALGLDWRYGRVEVTGGRLREFVEAAKASMTGLSVTAPLKPEAFALADWRDSWSSLTTVANTLRFEETIRAWNTDVGGIERALAAAGLSEASTAAIIGGGATAVSALVALANLGASSVTASVRNTRKASRLTELANTLGVSLTIQPLEQPLGAVDAAVSTLPASADVAPAFARAPGRLLDADYGRSGGSRYSGTLAAAALIDGTEMLIEQAVLQARIFVSGDVGAALPNEAEVASAMRKAVAAAR